MIYLLLLEAVTILVAFFIKILAFYLLIRFFNRTVKLLSILKPILLYELGIFIFVLISPTILIYPLRLLRLYLPIILLFPIFLLIFVGISFLIFYSTMRKFSILDLRKSLVVFLIILIITPSISFLRLSIISPITELPIFSKAISRNYMYMLYEAPFSSLPLSMKTMSVLNKIDTSLFERTISNEIAGFLMNF